MPSMLTCMCMHQSICKDSALLHTCTACSTSRCVSGQAMAEATVQITQAAADLCAAVYLFWRLALQVEERRDACRRASTAFKR